MSWPKLPPVLSVELQEKKRDWELYWLKLHPKAKKYSFVDNFTRDFIEKKPVGNTDTVLEIGPGPNSAIRYLKVQPENYYAIERNSQFCAELSKKVPAQNILNQDTTRHIELPMAYFDRIIAAHVFEHVLDLPPVLLSLRGLLKPGGSLDVILPCEAGLLYAIGRKFSSEREYKKQFGSGFTEIMRSEHVNTIFEIFDEIKKHFFLSFSICYPLPIPATKAGFHSNLLVGLRLT